MDMFRVRHGRHWDEGRGSLASGTGNTQQAAKDDALSLASDPGIRAALTSADPRRPHWVQGAAGEKREAARKATAGSSERRTRTERSPSAR